MSKGLAIMNAVADELTKAHAAKKGKAPKKAPPVADEPDADDAPAPSAQKAPPFAKKAV